MASVVFLLPDLGEGLPDAEIVEWHVKIGNQVQQDEPLVSVETDKAVVEVPSPYTGTLTEIHGKAGDVIQVNAPLAGFEVQLPKNVEPKTDAGTVVGKVETRATMVRESVGPIKKESVEVRATPAVRALAKRLNIDLVAVKPTGPDNVVTTDDVKRVANVLAELGPVETLRGPRKAMARTMASAHQQVVPVTLCEDADIDHWFGADDTSLRLIKAIVSACRVEPGLNAWFDNQAAGRRLLESVDLGIAVDTEDGLFVPVLHDVANREDDDLRDELDRLKGAIVARTIEPERLRGASFTLTNFGTMGGRYASPVVVPPSVAILGSGSVREEVVADNGAVVVRKIMPLSLTFDHRCITGGEAARFLVAIIHHLQS